MALIVSTTRLNFRRKSTTNTVVFEDEAAGRRFVKENKTFVFHVQKAEIVNNGSSTPEV